MASNDLGCRTEGPCSKIVKLFVNEKVYILTNDEMGKPTIFSKRQSLPIPIYLPELRVDKFAHFILVTFDSLGVKLKWDGSLLLQIEVSESMWNKTAGLCGTMNDDPYDEFLMQNGSYAKNVATLAYSWLVSDFGGNINKVDIFSAYKLHSLHGRS